MRTVDNPASGPLDWLIGLMTDPKTWGIIIVCGGIAWAIKKVFDSLPKSVLIILLLLGLMMAGYLHF